MNASFVSDTAQCPRCGSDSVIGDASGHALTDELVGVVRAHMFNESVRSVRVDVDGTSMRVTAEFFPRVSALRDVLVQWVSGTEDMRLGYLLEELVIVESPNRRKRFPPATLIILYLDQDRGFALDLARRQLL